MQPDFKNNSAAYWIQLPAQPEGTLNNVDPTGKSDKGVQIFAISYWPNLAGGPYSEGDDPTLGWPTYLASVKTDTENNDEVTGGKLLIWSPTISSNSPPISVRMDCYLQRMTRSPRLTWLFSDRPGCGPIWYLTGS